MIRFAEKLDKTESSELPDLSNYKEIKPILKTTDDKAQSFWEDVFGEKESSDDIFLTDEEIISEVFEQKESDFQFDFDIADNSIQEQLEKFDTENWNNLDESQKVEVVEEFMALLCEKLGIEEQPRLVLFEMMKTFVVLTTIKQIQWN